MDGGSTIQDYIIAYGKANGTYSATIIVTAPATAYTVVGLNAGDVYKFKVLARNSMFDSLYSSEVTELAA